MDIIDILTSPESKTLEFKRDLSSPTGVLRSIVAFANTAGGRVIIGVEDGSKTIVGVKEPHKLEEKIANLINDNIQPQLLPEIEVLFIRNTYLLSIQIFPSASRPHYLKKYGIEKGTLIRVGSTNRHVDHIMLNELQRVNIIDSFDKQPMPELSSDAIDFDAISEAFSDLKAIKAKDLESLELITTYQQKKVPTNGGMILFGKNRLNHFHDAWIQAGRFQGKSKTNILDTWEITSYPVNAVEEALQFIEKHAMRGIEIKAAKHTKKWSVPLTAVREAIINAVVHTDYSQQGSPIRLAIFDDRIEIENPGLLLFGLTIEEVKRGVSKLRNRVIGQLFFRLGLIERWGSGIKRIIDNCHEAGFPEPTFEEIGTHFRVTIYTEKAAEPILDDTEQLIIENLENANGLSTKELAVRINKAERTVRNRLVELINKDLVVEVGKGINDPKRKYFIKKQH